MNDTFDSFKEIMMDVDEKLEAAFWVLRWLHGDERVPEDMRKAWLGIMDAIEAAPDIYDTFDI